MLHFFFYFSLDKWAPRWRTCQREFYIIPYPALFVKQNFAKFVKFIFPKTVDNAPQICYNKVSVKESYLLQLIKLFF